MGSLQSNICLRLLLFFRAVKPCVTYPIGQREKCHSRVEIGLWRDWTLGFDEPSRHQKTNDEPPYGGWYRQTLMGMPVPAEDRVYTHTAPSCRQHTRTRAHEKVHMQKLQNGLLAPFTKASNRLSCES